MERGAGQDVESGHRQSAAYGHQAYVQKGCGVGPYEEQSGGDDGGSRCVSEMFFMLKGRMSSPKFPPSFLA